MRLWIRSERRRIVSVVFGGVIRLGGIFPATADPHLNMYRISRDGAQIIEAEQLWTLKIVGNFFPFEAALRVLQKLSLNLMETKPIYRR